MTTDCFEQSRDRSHAATESDRKTYVREWIARRAGGAAGIGTVGTLLTLPALAAAQVRDAFIDASQIDGVSGVELMADGSARLRMETGVRISVPAEDVQVSADGDVLVSDRVAEIASEVMATAGSGSGGAGIALGLGGIAAAAAAAGGGGGGGGGGGSGPDPLPVLNKESFESEVLGVSGGFNSDNTGITLPEGTASADVTITGEDGEETTVTVEPDEDGNWSTPAAETLPQGNVTVTVTSFDEDDEELGSSSQGFVVDTIPPTITIQDAGVGEDTVLNIAEQDAGITISGTAEGAEDGQIVTVTLSAGGTALEGDGSTEYTGTVTGEEWSVDIPAGSLADLEDDATVTVTANVEDAAGNAADPATDSFDTDLTAPTLGIDAISDDNQIGLLDVQGDLEVTGTTSAEVGQPVTLTFNGVDFTGSVISTGLGGAEPNAWSVTVPQSAIEAVRSEADSGDGTLSDIPVSATVSDAAGNPAETPASRTIDADFTGPSITLGAITGDNVINAEERDDAGGTDISGTTGNVGAGQDVTVTVNGTALPAVQTDATGQWRVTVPQGDASLPADGDSVTVTATVEDGDGIAATDSVQLSADVTAPTISLNDIAGDSVINSGESTQPLTISGTTAGAEAGQTVTLGIPGLSGVTDDVDASGDWSVTLTAAQTESLVTAQGDGASFDVTADVTDAAGNPAPEATRPVSIDITPSAVAIDALPLGGDALLNIAESQSDLEITGTATDTDEVTVSFNGTALPPVPVTGGTWSVTIPAADLGALPDGTIGITAEGIDAAGNVGSDSTSFEADLTTPTVAITDAGVGPDDILNITESGAGISVTGTTTGVADGQTVTVTLSGAAMATPIVGTATVTGNAFSVDFASGDLSGIGSWSSATVTAEVSDVAGNPADPATDSFDIDLVAPSIAFDDPPPADFVLGVEERDSLETEGVAVTTPEPDGTAVTLTFTRPDGSGGTVTDVTIDTTVSNGGTFDIPLTPAQTASLRDETTYTLDLAITDDAGNAGTADLTVPTDFEPFVFLDEIGEDGAVDVTDTDTPTITGTTIGVEQGQPVTVVVTAAAGELVNTTATVQADGTWSLPVDPSALDALEPGEAFAVTANVSNADGRAADEARADVDAYLASVYAVANTAEAGTALSISALAGEGLDAESGVETVMTFDTGRATYVTGSDDDNLDLFIVNADNAASGAVTFSGGTLSGQVPEGEVLYSFDMEDQGAGPVTLSFDDESQGGPTELRIGTSGADTLTAANTDSVLQGKGGDDSIDVSATGTNTIVFGLDQAGNGTDTVTGFTTGDTFQSDVIAFLGAADLRGGGDTVEALGAGGPLGADTGFVIFTTALDDTDAATLETAFEGLTGETAGDAVYVLAGDGSDAALARATVTGADDASVEILASFSGIGDLASMNTENVLLPDQTGTVV